MFAMIVGIVAVVYVGAALLSVLGLIFGTLFSVRHAVLRCVLPGRLGILRQGNHSRHHYRIPCGEGASREEHHQRGITGKD